MTGISGNTYEAWVEEPPEKVQILNVNFEGNLTAFILLEDGRRLEVLVTRTTQAAPQGSTGVVPRIVISVDNPDPAEMSPEELRRRLVPLLEDGFWCGHWPNPELDARNLEEATETAIATLDWDD